jgi:hypothetical protein
MTVESFLLWLQVRELEELDERELRDVLEGVLEQAPESAPEKVESLLEEMEDQLDAKRLDRGAMADWPERYKSLLAAGTALQDSLDRRAGEVPDSAVETPALSLLRDCLEKLAAARDRPEMEAALAQLDGLELSMARAWGEYSDQPFSTQALSAESVAGHSFLREGFQCWFEAIDLAKVGQASQALEAAQEGNRLFRAVADWSDELTG